MISAPLLSNKAIPKTVRAGFALIFSLAIVPLADKLVGQLPASLFALGGQVMADVVFGLTLGYLSRVLFAAVEMAGFFVDTQIGFNMINILNPFSEQQASVLSTFQYQLAITLYLAANGHLIVLGALAESFQTLAPGAVSPHPGFALAVAPILKTMFMLGLQLALPAAGVLLVVDVAFGLVARLAPQVNVFMVGQPAKVIVGLATVAVLLPAMALIVGQITVGTLNGLHTLIAASK